METKICTFCKNEYPKTTDYFFKKIIKQQNKSGFATYISFRSVCKSCNNKKTELNRKKKRCLEMNCDISEYDTKWKEQYTKTRTKDLDAKLKLTKSQYQRFINSEFKNIDLFIEKIELSKKDRDIRFKEILKANKKYFTIEYKKQALKMYAKNERERLTDAYIANMVMKKPIKEFSKEIIETKRLIIKLKRELKNK